MTVDTGWRARAIWLRRVLGTLVLALVLAHLVQLAMLVAVVASQIDTDPAGQALRLLLNLVLCLIPIVLVMWLAWRGRRTPRRRWGDWASRIPWRDAWRQGLLWGVPLAITSHLTMWLVAWLLGSDLPDNPLEMLGVDSPARLLVFVPYFVMLAPIAEEYLYRALLLERWSRLMPPAFALAASALVFAAVHAPGTLAQFLALLIPGVGLGVLWLRTRSLPAVAIAHMVNNVAAVTLLYHHLAS